MRAVHAEARFDHIDPMVRSVRYMPDFLAYRHDFPLAYGEAKVNSRRSFVAGNFSVERACYENKVPITSSAQVDYLFHRMFALQYLLLAACRRSQ